jgi:hypothetical protein
VRGIKVTTKGDKFRGNYGGLVGPMNEFYRKTFVEVISRTNKRIHNQHKILSWVRGIKDTAKGDKVRGNYSGLVGPMNEVYRRTYVEVISRTNIRIHNHQNYHHQ